MDILFQENADKHKKVDPSEVQRQITETSDFPSHPTFSRNTLQLYSDNFYSQNISETYCDTLLCFWIKTKITWLRVSEDTKVATSSNMGPVPSKDMQNPRPPPPSLPS